MSLTSPKDFTSIIEYLRVDSSAAPSTIFGYRIPATVKAIWFEWLLSFSALRKQVTRIVEVVCVLRWSIHEVIHHLFQWTMVLLGGGTEVRWGYNSGSLALMILKSIHFRKRVTYKVLFFKIDTIIIISSKAFSLILCCSLTSHLQS